METWEIVVRLTAASLIGAALGLNRDLSNKPTGLRTLGIVGLGSAIVVMVAAHTGDGGNVGRVIQGLVTGIGFLGAGVIIRSAQGGQVHGLTTAACAWLTACIGAACGVADWRIVMVGFPLVFILLVFGGRLERAFHKTFGHDEPHQDS